MKRPTVIHSLRVVTGFALLGAVTAGTFFGWLPRSGGISVHEVGAVLGAGLGLVANIKHAI